MTLDKEDLEENRFRLGYDESEMLVRHCFEFQRTICPGHLNIMVLIIPLVTEVEEIEELF